MAVSARVRLEVSAQEVGATVFGDAPKWGGDVSLLSLLGDGVTANKYDRLYIGERTVASATNDDIDLAGVLTSPLGVTNTLVEIVGIFVLNARKSGVANTTNLTIGAGSNPVSAFTNAGRAIGPGGFFAEFSPGLAGLGASGVTASTGDILRIANSSGAANTYQIVVLGRSA